MDLIYFSLGLACGLVVWGLALVCQRLQPTGGGRS